MVCLFKSASVQQLWQSCITETQIEMEYWIVGTLPRSARSANCDLLSRWLANCLAAAGLVTMSSRNLLRLRVLCAKSVTARMASPSCSFSASSSRSTLSLNDLQGRVARYDIEYRVAREYTIYRVIHVVKFNFLLTLEEEVL